MKVCGLSVESATARFRAAGRKLHLNPTRALASSGDAASNFSIQIPFTRDQHTRLCAVGVRQTKNSEGKEPKQTKRLIIATLQTGIAALISVCVGILAINTAAAPPNPKVLPSNSKPYGKSYGEWNTEFFCAPYGLYTPADLAGTCATGMLNADCMDLRNPDEHFGPTDGFGPAIADGYWFMLAPLKPGPHLVEFSSKSGTDFSLHVTYIITVVAQWNRLTARS